MKLLFIHEVKFKEDDLGNYYTDGSYNQDVWCRYLNVSNNLTVLARKEKKIYNHEFARKKFNFFDKDTIKFIEFPDLYSSLVSNLSLKKRRKKYAIIKKAVIENDFIIARLPSHAGNIAIHYAKKYNKKYLIEVVGCPWDALWNHSIKGKIKALPSYLSMKKTVKDAPYALYVSNEFLQHRYPCKGKTISCSNVLLPHYDNNVLEKRISKIKNMDFSNPIILGTTAAVNVHYKGQQYVIQAISKLKKEGYYFEYQLAGGGDNSYLKSVAEKYGVLDQVKFLGSLPHDQVFDYLDKIDIYIQPSKTEGLPRALIEAMSRGCPSIGSNAGGIPELINKKFVFKKGSVNEICKLLKSIDRKIMIEEANRSFEKAKEFDRNVLENRRMNFFKEFVECGAKK